MPQSSLKTKINQIYKKYHSAKYVQNDPLVCVRRFNEPSQVELVGFVASCLSYGRVDRIIYSVNRILELADNNLVEFTRNTTYLKKKRTFSNFKHRFTGGKDIALLLESVKHVLDEYGSLENQFVNCFTTNGSSMKSAMTSFSNKLRTYAEKISRSTLPSSFTYLVPSPSSGSACKRLNMYFRWVVRKKDGIDFGLWKEIPSSILIIPLDVHIARVAQHFSLTSRKSVDWKMAEQITATLRDIDPADPVKYDFSLCRYGMEVLRAT